MKYMVEITETRRGIVEVDANSEQKAMFIASGKEIEWYDDFDTDMKAKAVEPGATADTKAEEDTERTYIVTEVCPHCESEVKMRWNTDTQGFMAFCPVCGERLMLCDECRHAECSGCDYDSKTDSCQHNPAKQ